MGKDGVTRPGELPRSRSGRIPQWVLDEAIGREPEHPVPWRAGPPLLLEPRRRRRRGPLLVALAIVAAFAVAAYWGPSNWRGAGTSSMSQRAANTPTPGHEEAAKPLGTPAPLENTRNAYRFVHTTGNAPVAYSPCRPIHYVVRAQGAPAAGDALLGDAIARVSTATGLHFVGDGPTSEAASRDRQPYQPSRYGDRWAPVLIVWTTSAENADFAGNLAGQAGSAALSVGAGPQVYVSGQVELDAGKFTRILGQPGGTEQARARAIIEHELGHLVGLDHVADPSQLMFADNTRALTDYASGDLTGLAALGRGPCAPNL